MRKGLLILAGVATALPVTMFVPTAAQAHYRSRSYDNGDTYTCRKSKGTTGLIIGAAAGALLGRAVDGGRSRATGTIVGGGAGALLGRDIAKKRQCR